MHNLVFICLQLKGNVAAILWFIGECYSHIHEIKHNSDRMEKISSMQNRIVKTRLFITKQWKKRTNRLQIDVSTETDNSFLDIE